MVGIRSVFLLLWVLVSLVLVPQTWSKGSALTVEREMANLIKETYKDYDDVVVKVDRLPRQLREMSRIEGIDVVRPPEPGRPGLALVEYVGSGGKRQSSYVAFRTQTRKMLFYVKRNMAKGEAVEEADLISKESYVAEKTYQYPDSIMDLQGKTLRKDVQAGTLLTNPLVEERKMIKRGQTVTVVAQNRRLMVQTLGRAVQPGRRGELIKVKSLASEQELQGRVLDSGTVAVDF